MPPKGQNAERLQQEAEAQRARAAALQYLTKTGSGPSQKEIAQQQIDREKWSNPTTQAVQQRLAHLQPAPSSSGGGAPTRDNTLAAMAAHRARMMLQGSGGSGGDGGAMYEQTAMASTHSYGEKWRNGVVASTDKTDDLPDGWKPTVDPISGETYYWNEKTKETSWSRPAARKPTASDKTPTKDDEEEAIENGWEEVEDPQSGQTYFWHRESNETTWTKPVKKKTVSLEQAREAKSKLDAILKLCGPTKTSSTQQPTKQAESGTTKGSSQQHQNNAQREAATRKRVVTEGDQDHVKKARPNV